MTIEVLLFAAVRDAVGEASRSVTLDEGATAGDVVRMVREWAPAIGGLPLAVAVDEVVVPPSHRLRDGATVAILPPVSGG